MMSQATHLVVLREGTTVLCETHARAMQLITQAADVECDLYILPEDEEPISCQACRLAEINPNPNQLPH